MNNQLIKDIKTLASEERALASKRFFKTDFGQYGYGDEFIGISMPDLRKVCRQYNSISLDECEYLVNSKIHEFRMAGLVILVNKFTKEDEATKKNIYNLYIRQLGAGNINNWDLIDVTCDHIVGKYLADKPKDILYKLAKSDNLWERRASIMATFAYIKTGKSDETLKIAQMLLKDDHDLIHKSVGWMLREVGKRVSEQDLLNFLDKNYRHMPRTMLRYSIERLDLKTKQKYMAI